VTYGVTAVLVSLSGRSITSTFPLFYVFVFMAVGLVFGYFPNGRMMDRWQQLAATLMFAGFLVNVVSRNG